MLLSSVARAAASRSPRERSLVRTAGWRSLAVAARPAPAGLARLSHQGSRLSLSHRAAPPLPEVSAARATAGRQCIGQEVSQSVAPLVVRATASRQCTGQGVSQRPAAPAPGEAAAARPFGGPRLAIRSGPARQEASPARATDSQALAMRPLTIRGRHLVHASLPPAGAAPPAIRTRPAPIKADRIATRTHPPTTGARQAATRTGPPPIKTCRMTIGTGPAPGTTPLAIKVPPPVIAPHPPVGVVPPAIATRPPMNLKRQPATTMMTRRQCMAGARHFAALRGHPGSRARLARRRPIPAASPIMTSLGHLTSCRGRPCSHRRVGARKRR